MNKPVFVTGSTGVIGHALAKSLVSCKQKVIAPVRRRTDALNQLIASKSGLFTPVWQSHSPTAENFKVQQVLMRKCDVVYHLGGWASHKISDEKMPLAFSANVLWTLALAKMAIKAGVRHFVFASSRSIFEFMQNDPALPLVVNEKTVIDLPIDLENWKDTSLLAFDGYLEAFLRGETAQSPEEYCQEYLQRSPLPDLKESLRYPLTKLMGESIVTGLNDQGVQGTSLRLKPVFGPSPVEDGSRLIPKVIKQLLEERTATAWPEKTGFLFIEDLVLALEAFCAQEYDDDFYTRDKGNLILLGNSGQSISQLDLFTQIAHLIGPDIKVELNSSAPSKEYEIYDSTLAKQLLGFRDTPFSYALEKTMRYFMDSYFLNKAISLAARGNPNNVCKVGVLIVRNSEILGADYKSFRGRIHSDIMAIAYAIQTLSKSDQRIADIAQPLLDLLDKTPQSDLIERSRLVSTSIRRLIWKTVADIKEKHGLNIFDGATLYINLEPCDSFGYWIGCSEVIAKAGIKRVVIATRDPGIIRAGRGIENLKKWGVEVIEMEELSPLAQSIDPEWFSGNKIAAHKKLRKQGK